eukprot:TRINITY_DN11032_c0_g1_i1.p1 TRINITY_DN11032_c0_g1~~TRINITY_DN11032_c0_g1_i1.p1  ORF type:complete len:530 (-),score=118.10 TRINITY_DN11032_c0_g1_i1:20-1609(-)
MENTELGALSKEEINEMKKFFLREGKFMEHYNLQKEKESDYKLVLKFMFGTTSDLSTATKGRILAAAWARKDTELAKLLIDRGTDARSNKFGVPEVLRAVKLLDSNRRLRHLEKRLARLTAQGTAKPPTLGKIRAEINDLKLEDVQGSLSGSLCRFINKWVGTISKENLEFFALSLPKEPWRELSDLVHLNPKSFQQDWFLDFCFDKPIPGESMVSECSCWAKETPERRLELIKKWKLPYSFIRREINANTSVKLSNTDKLEICRYEDINSIIWYYEELKAPEIDDIVRDRLIDGELPTLSYGKLMQRLLDLKENNSSFYPILIPIADRMLQSISLPLEPPVVVIGDASGSMQVAVKTATIIGGLLACLTNADLRFFNSAPMQAPPVPKSVSEVIEVAGKVRAAGGTANAASLWESYEKKEKVNYFIMATDEEENQAYKGYKWLPLWKKYLEEVHSTAKMVFISFLSNNQKGQMVKEFDTAGLTYLQFVFDLRRPDLSKLDTLLALLSSGAADKDTSSIDVANTPDESS